jgi:asparagine synthase (glutamine-hydrolysing)
VQQERAQASHCAVSHCSRSAALAAAPRSAPAAAHRSTLTAALLLLPLRARSNSEIYNHEAIKAAQLAGVDLHSKSDSAIIGHLYQRHGDTNALWNSLDGIFACVIFDERDGSFCAARDPIGICSLYWGRGADGSIWFASEMKALQDACETIDVFPPGHVYRSKTGKLERWFAPAWLDPLRVPSTPADLPALRQVFVDAVVKRLMSDAPLGILLSGGLDSSLVASVAVRHIKDAANAFDRDHKLHTFSIGIAGSPDLRAARRVADFLGTDHHEFVFTVEEGIDALAELVYHIESYEQVRRERKEGRKEGRMRPV